MGLVEVEQLQQKYDLDVSFSPFFLDPSTPPEGKRRRQYTQPGDPPTEMERRAEALGIRFTRGRTWTSNSHLALEAAEYVDQNHPELVIPFHRAMFKAYFEDLADIGSVDLVTQVAVDCGVPEQPLRSTLEERALKDHLDEEIGWAYQIGVQAVPTFVVEGKHAIVGAQDGVVFEGLLRRLGKAPRDGLDSAGSAGS